MPARLPNRELLGHLMTKVTQLAAEIKLIESDGEAKMIAAGELLQQLKQALPYGTFERYCTETLKLDPRKARRWMERYRISVGLSPATSDTVSEVTPRPHRGSDSRHSGGTRTYEQDRDDEMDPGEAAMWMGDDDEEGGGEGGGGEPCGGLHTESSAPACSSRPENPSSSPAPRPPLPAAPVPPAGDVAGQMRLDSLYELAARVHRLAEVILSGQLDAEGVVAIRSIVDRVFGAAPPLSPRSPPTPLVETGQLDEGDGMDENGGRP